MLTWQTVCPVGMFNIKILNEMLTCLDFSGHISTYMAKEKPYHLLKIFVFVPIFIFLNKKSRPQKYIDLTKNMFLQSYICKSQ